MIVAVGSLRKPKLAAVSAAFNRVLHLLQTRASQLTIQPFAVASGISSMPLSLAELMEGAQTRARNVFSKARKMDLQPDFCIGMEGGFFKKTIAGEDHVFLQSWVYCLHENHGHFGSSGAVPVPREIIAEVYEKGAELGHIIDRYGREKDIRSKGGAYDVFTRGVINRQQSFELALVAALAPFLNPDLYRH